MDLNPSTAFRLLFKVAPLIVKTAVLHVLSSSQNAAKQDLRTEVIVAVIRHFISVRKPMSYTQRVSLKDPGVRGPIWISKATIPKPDETDALDLLLRAIKDLGDGTETYTVPDLVSVEAEWTGHRNGVSSKEPRPDISETKQYERLVNENPSSTTVLYFHGGAYFLMDPASHRATTSLVSKKTGGRCLSLRYRLAPQYPFPAALLDAFVAYLYLLSPPPDALHEPIPASSIVFSGDSAGGGLATSLLLLLLHLQRSGITSTNFHGRTVKLAPPAAIATWSPWLDLTHALPSIQANARYDYLKMPSPDGVPVSTPPPDHIWPASPPRAEIYCNASMMVHPLVSPTAAPASLWANTPPVFVFAGEECLTDGITATARQIHRAGGNVHFLGYEGMPHCFMMFSKTKDWFDQFGRFCVDATHEPDRIERATSGIWIKAKTNPPQTREVDFESLISLSDDEILGLMRGMQKHALAREEEALRAWEQQETRAKL